MTSDFAMDLKRYRSLGDTTCQIVTNPAVWAIAWYRFGRWVYAASPALLRPLLKLVYQCGAVFCDAFLQMRLNVATRIGPGLLIAHGGGITLHPRVIIGSHCDLAHHVTIGTPGLGRTGVPVLGDNVYVGTGAVLIGAIHVGDGARVAANSLVNRDVAAGAVVLGVPAREMSRHGREADPASAPVGMGA